MSEPHGGIDEKVRSEFEAAWIRGQPLEIADCLEKVDDAQLLDTLMELVLIDIEFSWKRKCSQLDTAVQPRLLESYLKEFPQLADAKRLHLLLEEEYQIRKRYGDQVRYADFAQRFPTIIDSLLFTESDAPDEPAVIPQHVRVGSSIGKFNLVDEIGEGGMGRVFVAEQVHPVRRRVALKVIRKGLNSKQVIARFEAERQVLAMMDHQNIARILDGGTTADGQPYFVMELVEGIPINQYCDRHALGLKQRLRLFVDVCAAVQHAHQKGIIHRDLKPTNILVTESDGQPVPKVIDFGLAKALNSEELLTDKTMATHIGQILGTFKYMSPEQADADVIDIDTRTDVYALGVILYELLTGSTPLDQRSLQNRAVLHILELIREFDPPRPSARLSSLHESTNSRIGGTGSTRLTQICRGDLDWVVMKALEKDRNRRYETASSFSDDIKRFLNHEPVVARPPSALYLFQKAYRKHRLAILSAAAVLVLLIAGISGTTWGLFKAESARQDAVKASEAASEARRVADARRIEADRLRQEADDARKVAEEQSQAAREAEGEARNSLARTKRVLDFVVSLFRRPDPDVDGRTVTIASVLENALKEIDTNLVDDPIEKSTLLDAFGRSFTGLGIFDLAVEAHRKSKEVAEKAWGKDSRTRASALNNLAFSYSDNGELEKAADAFDEALRNHSVAYGPGHLKTLEAMQNLAFVHEQRGDYARAVELTERSLELMQLHPQADAAELIKSMVSLVQVYQATGQLDKRLKLAEAAVQLAIDSFGDAELETIGPRHNFAVALRDAGRFDEALDYQQQALESSRQHHGENHPTTIKLMGHYAKGLHQVGRTGEATNVYENQIQLSQQRLGPDHPDTLIYMNNLGGFYAKIGATRKSLDLREEVYEKALKKLGAMHPDTLSYLNNYAMAVRNTGRFDQAMPLLEQLHAARTKKLGPDHPDTIDALAQVGLNHHYLGNRIQAVDALNKAVERRKALYGTAHAVVLRDQRYLGLALANADDADRAVGMLESTLQGTRQLRGERHPDTLETIQFLAAAYGKSGQKRRAIEMLANSLEIARSEYGDDHNQTIELMKNLVLAQEAARDYPAALELANQMLKITHSRFGKEHPAVYLPLSLLIRICNSMNDFTQARRYAEQALPILLDSRSEDNVRIIQTRQLLGQLYLRTGDFHSARKILQQQIGNLESIENPSRQLGLLRLYLADAELKLGNLAAAKRLLESTRSNADQLDSGHRAVLQILEDQLALEGRSDEIDKQRLESSVDQLVFRIDTLPNLDREYVIRGYELLLQANRGNEPESVRLASELQQAKTKMRMLDQPTPPDDSPDR